MKVSLSGFGALAALGFGLCLAAGAAAEDVPAAPADPAQAAPAAGTGAASPDPTQLQTVVVTAQKRSEAINAVPMAVSSYRRKIKR